MNEKPILFSAPMVLAILQGRKTQTRRVVSSPVSISHNHMPHDPMVLRAGSWYKPEEWSPYGQAGDRLWVRETWQAQNPAGQWWHEVPRTERNQHNWAFTNPIHPAYDTNPPRWLPSIHMPRIACRIELKITEVRIERLNCITEDDAVLEGCRSWVESGQITDTAVSDYAHLWNSINGQHRYGWDMNPWVWVITFRRINP